jgi:acyl-coenzyme A thioesterase PaaI-like protein
MALVRKTSRGLIKLVLRLYPPFLGAGIRVQRIADDFLTIEVKMRLRFWNKTGVGTHFGGSLYAMCDPFFMLILIRTLGPDYLVWDKAASIRFKKPGKGTVTATFQVPRERVDEIRAEADLHGKSEPQFQAVVRDVDDNVIAEVDKFLLVRKMEKAVVTPVLKNADVAGVEKR